MIGSDRFRAVLINAWSLAALTGAGMIVGFCLGGLVGPSLFGSLGGHGLGDMAYLFMGAGIGIVAGFFGALVAIVKLTYQAKLRLSWIALTVGAFVSGLTWIIANTIGW